MNLEFGVEVLEPPGGNSQVESCADLICECSTQGCCYDHWCDSEGELPITGGNQADGGWVARVKCLSQLLLALSVLSQTHRHPQGFSGTYDPAVFVFFEHLLCASHGCEYPNGGYDLLGEVKSHQWSSMYGDKKAKAIRC